MGDFLQWPWKGDRRPQTGPEAEEITALSDQFRVTLKASANKIRETEESRAVLARINELLEKPDWHWNDAYEVEQQIVLLYDEETLRTELARRVLEAQHVLYPDAAAWYKERVGGAATIPAQRALLLRLVNDLQWRYTVNEAKLGYIKQITGRTGWIFILAVVIFIGFIFVLFVGDVDWGEWWGHSFRFMTFLLAAVSGFLGASFSMVSGLKARLDSSSLNQMKNASSRAILLSRVLVGTGAAMILYFFFESKLLAGEAFPDLAFPENGAEEFMQRALLIVWCFIAGFSEKLVPGLLAKTEAQAGEQPQTMTHGARPQEVLPESTSTAAGVAERGAGAARSGEIEEPAAGKTEGREGSA